MSLPPIEDLHHLGWRQGWNHIRVSVSRTSIPLALLPSPPQRVALLEVVVTTWIVIWLVVVSSSVLEFDRQTKLKGLALKTLTRGEDPRADQSDDRVTDTFTRIGEGVC